MKKWEVKTINWNKWGILCLVGIFLVSIVQVHDNIYQIGDQSFQNQKIPASNSLSDVSYNLILHDNLAEIACLENETWGLIYANRTIAQVSLETGDYLNLFSDYGTNLTGLAVSEDYIYVSNCQGAPNNTILVLDKTNGLKVNSFDVGSADFNNWGLEYDDGVLWMDQENGVGYHLLKVDANTGTVLSNFTSPCPIAAGPHVGDLVYCVAYNDNQIMAFDSSSGRVLMKSAIPSGISGDWGLSVQGDYLVYSNMNFDNLYFVRTQYTTGELVYSYDLTSTFPNGYRLANNDTHLFIRPAYTQEIEVLEIETGISVRTLSLSFIPWGIACSNSTLWCSDFSSPGKIYKIGMDGSELLSFTPDPSGDALIAGVATDGVYLWVSFTNRTIAKIQISTQTIVEQFKLNGQVSAITYNAELNELFGISDNDDNVIYRINLESHIIDREHSISVSTRNQQYGLTLWRDKIIVLGDMNSAHLLFFLQNNLQATESTTDDNVDDVPELFGFNAYYVVGAGAGIGLILGLVFGGLLFSKKKK